MADASKKWPRSKRPSISVSGRTYALLREAHPSGNLAAFVDEIVAAALADPALASRLVEQCHQAELYS